MGMYARTEPFTIKGYPCTPHADTSILAIASVDSELLKRDTSVSVSYRIVLMKSHFRGFRGDLVRVGLNWNTQLIQTNPASLFLSLVDCERPRIVRNRGVNMVSWV